VAKELTKREHETEKRFLAEGTESTLGTRQGETTETPLGRLDWFLAASILIECAAAAAAQMARARLLAPASAFP